MAKWIEDIGPAAPVSLLAERTLKARLRNARAALDACQHDCQHEQIHRLRVAMRRAVAALEAFRDWLPTRRQRKLKKLLHQGRRAAGKVRDLDVFARQLEPSLVGLDHAAALVATRVSTQRRHALPKVARVRVKFGKRDFRRQAIDLLRRVRWRAGADDQPEPTVRQEALRCLQPAIEQFRTASQADLSHIDYLHGFRIAGKNLRYSLEIFGNVIDEQRRDALLAELIELQDRLGDINDLWLAVGRLNDWIDDEPHAPTRAELVDLCQRVQARLDDLHAEVLRAHDPDEVQQFLGRLEDALLADEATNNSPSRNGQAHGSAPNPTAAAPTEWLPDFTD